MGTSWRLDLVLGDWVSIGVSGMGFFLFSWMTVRVGMLSPLRGLIELENEDSCV